MVKRVVVVLLFLTLFFYFVYAANVLWDLYLKVGAIYSAETLEAC